MVDPHAWERKMKNEQSLESLHEQVKVEDKCESSSSDSAWEEVDSKIIAVDCSCVHTLIVNAYQNPNA